MDNVSAAFALGFHLDREGLSPPCSPSPFFLDFWLCESETILSDRFCSGAQKHLGRGRQRLSAHLFDVALVDLGLSDSEGLATVTAIMKWGPSLPIVILTGHDDDQSARAAIQLGAQDYLVKGTIVPDLFYRAIRYSIERKSGGEIVNFVAVKSDITAALILEEKYYNAQKMEAIGTLAGGISHDFINILTSILGYAMLVQRALADDAPGKENLGQILIAANRAKDLVRQILDFSRRSDQDMQAVQTHLIVKEALKLLRDTIPENVDIKDRLASKNTTALCNPTRFH